MTSLTTIAPKLDPLIRRLASDSDGEVIGCVRAIGRQLNRAGASWHDLADKLTSAPEMPKQRHESATFYDYLTAVEWILRTNSGELSDRDVEFAESMRGILYRRQPTAKQAAWLRGLVGKMGGRFHG
jgi:hypothetical protein